MSYDLRSFIDGLLIALFQMLQEIDMPSAGKINIF
jgi:hypothetical protein